MPVSMHNTRPITMRSTRAQMYAEIKRLRELCEWQTKHLLMNDFELIRLRNKLGLSNPESRDMLENLKAFSAKYKCDVRWQCGVFQRYSKERNCWVDIPRGEEP